jgi:hypothetical protein
VLIVVGKVAASEDCCCGGDRVLMWDSNNSALAASLGLSDLAAIYTGMGLTVDSSSSWTTDINDYRLIHWFFPTSDPTWWSAISGGTWNGRICMCVEHNLLGLHTATIAYVAGKSGVTGLTVTGGAYATSPNIDGTIETDDLTAGMTAGFYVNQTSKVAGGTTLSFTNFENEPWLARNTSGTIDFVVAGNADHATNGGGPIDYPEFFENLYLVSI